MFISTLTLCVTPMLLLFPAPAEPEQSDKGWGYLGVSYVDEVQGQSIRITDVYDGTPAQLAGLRPGDLLTGLNGNGVTNTDAFTRSIVRSRPSSTAVIDVLREGVTIKLKVKLGVRPENFPHPFPEMLRD